MFKSLRARLIFYFSLSIALSILVSALIAIGLAQIYIKQAAVNDLSRQAEILAGHIGRGDLSIRLLRTTEKVANTRVFILKPEAESPFFGPDFNPSLNWENLAKGDAQVTEGLLSPLDLRVIVVAQPLFTQNQLTGAVILARPLEFSTEPLLSLSRRLLLAALISLVLSSVFAFFLARRISEPLKQMTEASKKIAQGDYGQRVNASSADELGKLVATFNEMAKEVKLSQELQKDFIANVSHELKTPLTSIQGFTEALLENAVHDEKEKEKFLEIIAKESKHLERLIQDLLDIAKLDSKHFCLDRTEIDLKKLLKECEQIYRGQAKSLKVKFKTQIGALSPIYTDGNRLRQIVRNLLDNALKFTPAGGKVSLQAAQENSKVLITVSDTGTGIDTLDLPHIFERFYHAKKGNRKGFGLGLAIASELAKALGGTVTAESKVGEGSSFKIMLPFKGAKSLTARRERSKLPLG